MLLIWFLLSALATILIYTGSKLCDKGHNETGTLFILVGIFQFMAELVVLLS